MSIKKEICGLEFELLSEDLLKKISVAEIKIAETYDDDGYPMIGGLMDPRLGVIDPGLKCKTCGENIKQCMGHVGYIKLVRPVINVGYVKEIYTILRMTCPKCGRVKIDDTTRKKYENLNLDEKIFAEIEKEAEGHAVCPFCNAPQPKIKFSKPYSYYEVKDKNNEVQISVMEIDEWLRKIPDEDLKFLDLYVRPENMIMHYLPVIPICARPSVTLESAGRSEDDLTHKMVDILRVNDSIKAGIDSGAPQIIIEDYTELLQYHIATLLNNELSGVPPARQRSGRPLKTIAQRLKGKEGRFRNNISGKRVNFSARTVISPDPNIDIDEVGVPIEIAKELTVPETVQSYNIDFLKRLVNRGNNYPGAITVICDGKRKRILDLNKEILAECLKIGDVVERHIMDGDIVVFNRQPSLHRISMMGHRIKVMPGSTFRLNVATCAPYNADFDGDEMNLHVPQSEEAMAEARTIMEVENNIISPRYGGPIIGGRHDHVTGAYILTKKEKISREDALQLCGGIVELPKNKEYFTGKELFSLLLPKDLNLEYINKFKEKVVIKEGQILSGSIDAEGMAGKIVEEIYNNYGPSRAAEYINLSTRLAIRAITKYGFSIGIDSTDLKGDANKKIEERLNLAMQRINEYIKEKEEGKLKPRPGKSAEDALEDYIMMELANARNDCGKIAEVMVVDETPVIMAKTGARGSLLNLTQMSANIGQQAVRGKRIYRGYSQRTLSAFKKGDASPKAHGFIASSFKKGLSPIEYFFHAMGGRETLVDTAIRTGRSGYFQRRIINALLDLKVDKNKAVRDSKGNIIQFMYGEDGIDPAKKSIIGEERKGFEWFE